MKCLLWLPLLGAFISVGTSGCSLPDASNDENVTEAGTAGTTLAGIGDILPQELTDLGNRLLQEMAEWTRRGLPSTITYSESDDANPITSPLVLPTIDAMGLFTPDYEQDVVFYFFNQDNPNGTAVGLDPDQIREVGWNSSLLTKVLVHGWGGNINAEMIQNNKKALLEEGDYNVIGVDWGKLAPGYLYITSRSHVKGVAQYVAKFLGALVDEEMLSCENLHVIGHSLGAHVAGTIGKEMLDSVSCHPARVTGLDPAMPLFLLIKGDRIENTDGDVVDIIHTCAGFLGIPDALGTVDFYPNGGQRPQPGCGVDITGTCSHGRSHQMFAESIIGKGSFNASLCADQTQALDSNCPDGNATSHMGFWLRAREPGSYYLQTADSYPFDLREHEEVEQNRKG